MSWKLPYLCLIHLRELCLILKVIERRIKTNQILCYRCLATRAKSEQSLSLVFSMQNVKKQKQWSLKEPTDLCRLVEIILKVLVLLYLSIHFSCRAKTGGSRNLSGETSYLMKPTDSYLKTN